MKVKAMLRIIGVFCLIISLCATCYSGPVQAKTGKDLRLDSGKTSGKGYSNSTQLITGDNGHVYIVWHDDRNGNSDIYFDYSSDNGVTWQTIDTRLDTGDEPGASDSSDPQLFSDGKGHVYVVWEDRRNGDKDIYFNYSKDNGVTWQKRDIRLDIGDAPGASDSYYPHLSSDGKGHVYVVWVDYRDGLHADSGDSPDVNDIYFNYSKDNGVTWQTSDKKLNVTDRTGFFSPKLCNDGNGYVYVISNYEIPFVWGDIYFNYSKDNGATWQTSDKWLVNYQGEGVSRVPQLSCDSNGHVYVVWKGGMYGDDIYFDYSKDNGATWQTSNIKLDTGGVINYFYSPQLISTDDGHVYVKWTQRRNGSEDTYFNYSSDNGVTWQTSDKKFPLSISSDSQLINDGKGYISVVWSDLRNGNSDIYFNYSVDNGVTWQASDKRLDTGDAMGASDSFDTQLISDGEGHIYTVWKDDRNGGGDIYFNYSMDNGVTWQDSDIRLNTDDAPSVNGSYYPQFCSAGNEHLYVAWNYNPDTHSGIHFNYFFIDKIINVNDFVKVNPITSTYHQTSDTTGCPDGFVGKFSFDVEIKNTSNEQLSDLEIKIIELTGGNVLIVAEGEPGGEGTTMAIPKTGDYSDSELDPGEYVVLPFIVCLKELKPFELLVDVLGKPGD